MFHVFPFSPFVIAAYQDPSLVSPSQRVWAGKVVARGWASDGNEAQSPGVERAALSPNPVILLLPDALSGE